VALAWARAEGAAVKGSLARYVVPLVLVLVLVLGLPAAQPAAAQVEPDSGARYFPETGFWVDELFVDYWDRNGGLMTFGYPLTRLFYQDGLHRQYFERAIFEHHEDKAGTPYAVLLMRLGAHNTVERRKTDPYFQPRPDDGQYDPDDVYFAETGQALHHQFRGYWEINGGLQTFGYPLSAAFVEPGLEDDVPRLVQYFERARFEWHPELAGTPYEILLGHLGREALARRAVPVAALRRQPETSATRDAGPLPPLPAGTPTDVDCGFNYAFWLDIERDALNAEYLDRASEAGCTWLRLQFNWSTMEPTRRSDLGAALWPYERIVSLARRRDLKLLVVLNHPPDWARPADPTVPADPRAFAAFARRVAARFAGQVDAWQVWNEPNLVAETNGRIDPAGFLPLLRAAYPAIKAGDPNALVVLPSLGPVSLMLPNLAMDNLWYLETLLALNGGEASDYFDVVGMHAYGAGNDPDTYWPGNLGDSPGWTGVPEFYFRSVERIHNLLVAFGLADRPIWITEVGWPVGGFCETWGYGAWITEELQAAYLVRAIEIMRTEWHWVEVAFVWHLNAAQYSGAGSCYSGFSLFDASGQPRPAYDALAALMAAQADAARFDPQRVAWLPPAA
jgi:hypothetical protein